MCLGIPPEAIPISEGGEMEPMFHQQWLARRRWLEQNASRDWISMPVISSWTYATLWLLHATLSPDAHARFSPTCARIIIFPWETCAFTYHYGWAFFSDLRLSLQWSFRLRSLTWFFASFVDYPQYLCFFPLRKISSCFNAQRWGKLRRLIHSDNLPCRLPKEPLFFCFFCEETPSDSWHGTFTETAYYLRV